MISRLMWIEGFKEESKEKKNSSQPFDFKNLKSKKLTYSVFLFLSY